jgi:hypothetical protein
MPFANWSGVAFRSHALQVWPSPANPGRQTQAHAEEEPFPLLTELALTSQSVSEGGAGNEGEKVLSQKKCVVPALDVEFVAQEKKRKREKVAWGQAAEGPFSLLTEIALTWQSEGGPSNEKGWKK